MFSRFFIDRPIFAAVLSIVVTLTGGIALFTLPMAQYPQITPPTVQVDCSYPGASAQVVSETVAAPIEQQVNGVENMLYMSSQCTNDGAYNLTVTFRNGVDLNMAQVLVQNRVNLALPQLPDVIKQTGVTTRKRSPDILMSVNINSPHGRYNQLYLSNFALMQIKDELARVPGVSDVSMMGQRDYSMRIWVNPEKLAERNMIAGDVVAALREQNAPVASGQLGQPPVPRGQEFQTTLSTPGRLTDEEQFGNVIIKTTPEGRMVQIKDVARVELGAKNQDISAYLDGKPSVGLAVFQLPDANALDTADRVRAKMDDLQKRFPDDVIYEIQYDTTPFIRESVNEVFYTLIDAVVLVAIVVLVFLQNWRSALIPLVAVPVAIVGTFAVMAVFGFSLNNLTLFGLVLAIGIVVDDAIVVVEAVEHHIEQGMQPREATIKAMEQVSGPVIAVGLVLSAVFLPCAFISGITGQFFRQFALTIAASTVISTFNSLTLSPALAALLLKPRDKSTAEPLPRAGWALLGGWLGWQYLTPWLRLALQSLAARMSWDYAALSPRVEWWAVAATVVVVGLVAGWFLGKPLNWVVGWLFRGFNIGFNTFTNLYTRAVGGLLRVSLLVLLVYGGLLGLTGWLFTSTPTGFIPTQDMGYLLVNVQLPDAASAERTRAVMERVEQDALKEEGVKHTLAISGQSLLLSANGSNFGSLFVLLDDYGNRRKPQQYSEEIAARLRKKYAARYPEAVITVFGPPPVRGVGRAGGFKVLVEELGESDPKRLQGQADNLVAKGNQQPGLTGLFSVFRANVPQLYVDVNRTQTMSMGVPLQSVFDTLQVFLGSLYVNDFNKFGRTWQVAVQADAPFRNQIDDVKQLKVRNTKGGMVPLGALATVSEVNGPLVLTRYNRHPAAAITGNAAPGISSGQSISIMEDLANQELPKNMGVEWTEMAFLELQAGNTATLIFCLAVLMVFLVLAAQYESWSLPLAVILVVPMCLLSAILGVVVARMDINIFTRIGFVVLVGLASKNAILIVEFARKLREDGTPRYEATLEAVKLRLRPIMMTSFAFILGVVPLLVAVGAGAEMRRTLGTAVFAGMLGVTLFGIFLTPVFFYLIDALGELPIFSSPLMRRLNRVSLDVLTLGILRGLWRRN